MIHDPKKRKANLRKHRVDLSDCYEAFDAPMLTREDTSEDYGEQRFVSLGLAKGNVVVLVWVDGEDEPRLISCRKAEPHEEEAYYHEYRQI
jgi:hypothetical protein